MHYGEEIINCQKREGNYGDIFSFDEYQALHAASTSQLFEQWIATSDFKEVVTLEDPESTYEIIKLVEEKKRIKSQNDFEVSGTGLGMLLIPLMLLPFLFKCYQLSRIQKKIDRIVKNNS